jgi:predicted permease
MISTILNALLPIIFVTLLAWLARRLRLIGPDAITTLSTFVVSFALPLSLFLAAAHTKPAQLTDAAYAASLAAGLLGTYALGILVSGLMFRHDMQTSALEGLTCGFPNMAYCGPPVLTAAVGAQGLVAVIVGNLVVTLIMVPLTIVLVHFAAASNAGKKQSEVVVVVRSLVGAVKQPLVWLPVLGAVLAIAGGYGCRA